MTKEEVIIQMEKGVKITHKCFTDGEWMTMDKGKIILEDGVRCKPYDFWEYRQGDIWNDGYLVFKN